MADIDGLDEYLISDGIVTPIAVKEFSCNANILVSSCCTKKITQFLNIHNFLGVSKMAVHHTLLFYYRGAIPQDYFYDLQIDIQD